MEIDDLERGLETAAARLTKAAAALRRLDPGPRAFGADGPGRLGDLGRAMSAQLATALDARGRQADTAVAAVTTLATNMRAAATSYRDTDASRDPAVRGLGSS